MNILTRTAFPIQLALFSLTVVGVNPQSVVHAADGSHEVQRSQKVSFADLDLTNRHGTVTLYTRILNAARSVCGPVDIGLADDQADWTRCVNDAIATAVAKVGDANLTDYYLVKTNRSHPSLVQR